MGNLSRKTYRWLEGGLLVQNSDIEEDNCSEWTIVTKRKPTSKEKKSAQFAFKVVRFLKSNAICIANNTQTIGIGVGQPNRVGSLKIALENMKKEMKKERRLQQPPIRKIRHLEAAMNYTAPRNL